MAKREKLFNIRLTEREHLILSVYAEQVGVSASEVVRDLIKALAPKIKDKGRIE